MSKTLPVPKQMTTLQTGQSMFSARRPWSQTNGTVLKLLVGWLISLVS